MSLKQISLSVLLTLGFCASANASTDAAPLIVAIDSAAPDVLEQTTPGETTPKALEEVTPAANHLEEQSGETALVDTTIPSGDTSEAAGGLVGALKAGKWVVAIGFALLLIVGLARRLGGQWAKTKTGGYVLGFGVPIIGAVGLAMTTGAWSLDLFIGALSAGLAASGLYTSGKDAKKAAGA